MDCSGSRRRLRLGTSNVHDSPGNASGSPVIGSRTAEGAGPKTGPSCYGLTHELEVGPVEGAIVTYLTFFTELVCEVDPAWLVTVTVQV